MKFAYRNAEGGIAIVVGAPRAHIERSLKRKISDEEYRALVAQGIPKDATEVQQLPDDWQPIDDRTFRDAWEIDGKGVKVWMERAREIHKQHLRRQRESEFDKLDVEQMIALGYGDKAEQDLVEAKKQKLRDAPSHPAIAMAKTPDELKEITLETLTK